MNGNEMEKTNAGKEDLTTVPDNLGFEECLITLTYFVRELRKQNGKFAEVNKEIKENLFPTMEKLLGEVKNKFGDDAVEYKRMKNGIEKYPKRTAKLNEIFEKLNSLTDEDEEKFKRLAEEAKKLVLKNKDPYFP